MERWSGRVALVTGGGGGIGSAICRLLAQNGMKVVAADLRLSDAQKLAVETGGEIHPIQCDVTKEEDIIRVMQWIQDNLGGADVLVNCAGVAHRMNIADLDTAKCHQLFDVNVIGLLLCTREVLANMKQRGVDDGHIFNINSALGQRIVSMPKMFIYQATKHAVTVLTEGLREELRDIKSKIKITSLSPGLVHTDLPVHDGTFTSEQNAQYFTENPCLEPESIAKALLYALATPPLVQELSKESKGEIHAQKCDVTKEEDVIQLVRWTRENLGGVHVLVNNAGVYVDNPIVESRIARGHTKEESDKFYNSIICLESEDVANALLYALASPPHVQVHELTILPVQQAG
ncbi:hypothetical protein B566_EDAN011564 [Ephemera danica]|nr:hypothetical protein B566_EDAN011564 [Ephemera danica]